MLTLRQLTLARGTKQLLIDANATIFARQKVGFVGKNGSGKSSLFRLILGDLSPESGEVELSAHLRISHLAQHIPNEDTLAIDYVLAGDEAYQQIQNRLKKAHEKGDELEMAACHNLLSEQQGYSKPALAGSILSGLGFKASQHHQSVNSFSGGWRMRLNLARCLMNPADLMLLDEPTNHLDLEAIVWLERWLKQTTATVIVISHDRDFLDAITTHILHLEHQQLTLYSGNYSAFEIMRAQKLLLEQARFEKQKKKIDHMMSFVERFKAKASKAKQAQSRLKAIEKMDVLAQAQFDSPFSFEFMPSTRVGKPLIRCEDITVGYHHDQPILKHIEFTLNPGERIALLGANGEGKSTFIKTLMGDLAPFSGQIHRASNLNIGYFAQHQLEQIDERLSPVQLIQALTPNASEQHIRDFLGGFNFSGDMALTPCKPFSGGEKARLALAQLVWLKPNLLLLDEPTNHLDLDMRSAIELAFQSYEGGLILISHDRHLLRTSVDEFYLVAQQRVKAFAGDLNDYYQLLQTKDTPSKQNEKSASISYREKKSMQNRLKKLEAETNAFEQKIACFEEKLADSSLYEEPQKNQLQRLMDDRDHAIKKLQALEEEWLDLMAKLEAMED